MPPAWRNALRNIIVCVSTGRLTGMTKPSSTCNKVIISGEKKQLKLFDSIENQEAHHKASD
jgi:hypothetical protein